MTPATSAKAEAIRAASAEQPWDMPKLLAMLTSANKDEREQAKRGVRDMARIGANILQANQDAADLAHFANRHEP